MGELINGVDFDTLTKSAQWATVVLVTSSGVTNNGSVTITVNGALLDIVTFGKRIQEVVNDNEDQSYRQGVYEGKQSAIRALATLIENEDTDD